MNTMRNPFYPASCRGHSMETALLLVKNDITAVLDKKGKAVLVMLHLSSAVNIIHHDYPVLAH